MAEPARTPNKLISPSQQTTENTPTSGVRDLAVYEPQEAATQPDLGWAAYTQAVALYDTCVRYAPATSRRIRDPIAVRRP
jgi:hypothetical protein